jgi:signal transduction histidine kinase
LAHEFGNLSFPLQMILELQARSNPLSEQEVNQILRSHVAELTTITTRFRWIGRCLSGRMAPCFGEVRPVELLRGAIDASQRRPSTGGHAINSDLSAAPGVIWADRDLLQQALAELLGNAVRFTPVGGRIDVTIKRENDSVELLVCDHGPGVATELQSRIFEPFVHGGTKFDIGAGQLGCGLALVKRIAAVHRGSVELRRSSADGSEFALCLPAGRSH